MSKLFAAAIRIAEEFKDTAHDTRTEMLQGLRDAMHPTCVYYRFLYRLVCAFRPLDIIEIGTHAGVSAAHMAEPNSFTSYQGSRVFGSVITVDINPDAQRCVAELPYFDNKPICVIGDSMKVLSEVKYYYDRDLELADILYIDGEHTFARAYQEYYAYRELVRDRGLILIDDAGLPMGGDEMNVFWESIPEPKQRVDWLHPNVGFGIVEKRDHISPTKPSAAIPFWDEVILDRRRQ